MMIRFIDKLVSKLFRRAPKQHGRSLGRWRTCDATPKKTEPEVLPLTQQDAKWFSDSCLNPKDVPGTINPNEHSRTIWFYDIDGKRKPEADGTRYFDYYNRYAKKVIKAGEFIDPDKKKKYHKYRSPEGEPPHFYYPQNPRRDLRALVKKHMRLIVTEGVKKAAAANKFGFEAVVGIQGCQGFRSKKHGLLMLPEFNDFNEEFEAGCAVYLILDRDRKPRSVADVFRATNMLALLLQERGAKVYVVELPLLEGYDKVGLDDFLHHYSRGGKDMRAGRDALEERLSKTKSWKDFEITEPGNAQRWIEMYGLHEFRYDSGMKDWRVYRDGCWRRDTKLEHLHTVEKMFADMLADARDMGNSERFDQLRQHVTAQRIENVPRLARLDQRIIICPDQFDKHPLFINCKNGTLELPEPKGERRAVRFRPHDPADLLTKSVTVNWNPDAKCPTFLKAMDFWTGGKKDVQRTVQQWLGICCTGLTREQLFAILYGPTQTGKTTLIERIAKIFGQGDDGYAVAVGPETLVLRRNGAPEQRRVVLFHGKRFASASETNAGDKLDENLIKQITGEDTLEGRYLYQEVFNFIAETKVVLRTNYKPDIRGGNEIWRRVLVLPFGNTVPPEKRDPDLKQKLADEAEGILVWMIEGYLDYAENGLVLAQSIIDEREAYRKEQDTITRFFDEKCELGPLYWVRKEQLHLEYAKWAFEQGIQYPLDVKKFKAEIENRFAGRVEERQISIPKKEGGSETQQAVCWVGATLKSLAEGSSHKLKKKFQT